MWHRHRNVLVSPPSAIDRTDLKELENKLTIERQQDTHYIDRQLAAVRMRLSALETPPSTEASATPPVFAPQSWRVWIRDRGHDGRALTGWWTHVYAASIQPGPYDPEQSFSWYDGNMSGSGQLRVTWRRKSDTVEVTVNAGPPLPVTFKPVMREWIDVDAPGLEGRVKVRFE